ncbi:MAG: hypothetical protein IOMNBAOH_00990 [Rhodocyclaceae bacterium]|nr:transposase [Rhodocyclaceae bacterium]MCG3186433.1 hypothetical protein [Rhodocyclaceae bacterium]
MRIDFLCFLGLTLTDSVQDETALVRFGQRLMKKNLLILLFDHLNDQLTARGLLVKKGTLIDGRLVQSARANPPKDGGGTADTEAGFGVRRDTVMHGYKAHVAIDAGSEIVRAVIATPANVHDSVAAGIDAARARVHSCRRLSWMPHRRPHSPLLWKAAVEGAWLSSGQRDRLVAA